MSSQEPRTYLIGDGPVRLEVVSGSAQKTKIAVRLNGTEVARDKGSVTVDFQPPLDGARVEIFAVVSHTGPTTPFSVTHTWTGGPEPREDVDEGDFATDPDPSFVEPIYHLLRAE